MKLLFLFWILKYVAEALLLSRFDGLIGLVPVLFFCDFFSRSGLSEDSIPWFNTMIDLLLWFIYLLHWVHCFSCFLLPVMPSNSTWKLVYLSFCGYRPCQIRHYNCDCPGHDLPFSKYPKHRTPAFLPMVITLVCVCKDGNWNASFGRLFFIKDWFWSKSQCLLVPWCQLKYSRWCTAWSLKSIPLKNVGQMSLWQSCTN